MSRSVYICFDVGEEGLILINGASVTCKKLVGLVTGNPGMGEGAPARVIVINEVDTGLPTRLRGPIEVYGPKAQLIIANPAGIILEQASFFNVSKVTLVSGKGCWSSAGQLIGFDVGEKGRLRAQFEGSILDGVTQIDLVSRVIKLSGEAHLGGASLFQATAGLGRYDMQSQDFEPQEAAASTPQQKPAKKVRYGVVGDSSSGIYAGQIRIKSLEPGVGILAPSRLVAQKKKIVLTASGDTVLQNLSAAKVLVRVVEGSLDLEPGGKIFVTRSVHLSAGVDLTLGTGSEVLSSGETHLTATQHAVAGGLIQSEAALRVKAKGMDQTEAATFQARGDIRLEVSQRADLKGKIYGSGRVVAGAEDLAQGPNGTLQGRDGVEIQVVDVAKMGGQTNSQTGPVTLNAKTLEQGPGGIHGHTGVQLTLKNQAISKGPISSSAGSVQIIAEDVKVESEIQGKLGVEVRVKQALKAPSLISDAGRVTIQANSFSQSPDTFIKGHDGIEVSVSGKVDQTAPMVSQNGPLTINGETVVCCSGFHAKGPVTVTATKELHHAGETVSASDIVFKAPEIQVYQDSLVAGSRVTFAGEQLGIQGNILKESYNFKFRQLHATQGSYIGSISEETLDFITKRLGAGPSLPVKSLGSKVSFDPVFQEARHEGVVKTKGGRTFKGRTFIQGLDSVCESAGSLVIHASQSVVNEGTIISQGRLALTTQHLHQMGRIGVTGESSTLKVMKLSQGKTGMLQVAGDLTLTGHSVFNEGHLEVGEAFQGRLSGDLVNQKLVSCGVVDLALEGTLHNTPGTFGVRSVFLSKGPMEIRGLSKDKAELINNQASLMESLQGHILLKAIKVLNLREVVLGEETQVWRRHNSSLQDLPPELACFKSNLQDPKFLRSDWTICRNVYDPNLSEPEALILAGGGDLLVHVDFLENGSSNLQASGRVGLFGGTYFNHGKASATHMVHTWVERIHEIWSSNSFFGGSTKNVWEPRTFEEPLRLAVEVAPSGIFAGGGFVGDFENGVCKAPSVELFSDFPQLTPAEQTKRNQTIAFYRSRARTEGLRRYPVGDFLPSGPVSKLQHGEGPVESYGAAFAPQPQTIGESLASSVPFTFQTQLIRTVTDLVSSGLVVPTGKAPHKCLGGLSALTRQAPLRGEIAWKLLWKPQDPKAFAPQREAPHLLLRTKDLHIDSRAFVSSDYFLSRVNVLRNDPERLLRLGDAFVECRLIRDQLLQLTGHLLLRGFTDEASMIKALYEAGAAFVQDLHRHKRAPKRVLHPPKDMVILEPVEMIIPANVEGALAQLSQAFALTQEAVTQGVAVPKGAMQVIELWAPRLYLSEETLAKWRSGTVAESILTKFKQTADLSGQTYEALEGALTHTAQKGLLQHGGANQGPASVNLVVPDGPLDQVSVLNQAGENICIKVQQLVQRRDNPEGFHTHGTTRHVGSPMTNIAGQDVLVSVDTESLQLGVDTLAKRNICLNLKGKAAIGSVTREYRAYLGGDAWWHRDEGVSHERSTLKAGSQIHGTLGDDLLVAGLKAKARESIKLKGKKDITFLGVQTIKNHAHFSKSDGGLFGKSIREEVRRTRLESLPEEFKVPLSVIQTDGNLLNRGTQYEGQAVLSVKGETHLQAIQDRTENTSLKQNASLLWQKTNCKGDIDETYTPVGATKGLTVCSPNNVEFELPQGQKVPENLKVEGLTSALGEQAVSQLLVKQLHEVHEHWNETQQGLTPGASAVLGLVLTMLTGGAGGPAAKAVTALGFSTKWVGFAAAKAGVQAVATATVVGTANRQGNLGKALEDLTKPQTLRSIAASMVTAGAVENLTTNLKLPNAPHTFAEHFQKSALSSAVSMPANMAIGGADPGKALADAALSTVANTLGGFGAAQIGKNFVEGIIDCGEHKILHAALGGLTGMILDPNKPLVGLLSGATGAFVAEVVVENLPDSLGVEMRGDLGRLAGPLVAFMAGQDVEIAAQTAENAIEHNFLPSALAAGALAMASQTETGQTILAAIDAKTQETLKKVEAIGFENLDSVEKFLVCAHYTGVLREAAYEEIDALTSGRLSLVNSWLSNSLQWVGEVAGDAFRAVNASETLASYGEAFTVGALGALAPGKAKISKNTTQSALKPNLKGIGKKKLETQTRVGKGSSRVAHAEAPARRSVVIDETHFSRDSSIQLLEKKGCVTFDGVEFRAVRNLEHLDEGTLRKMYKKGTAPKDVNQAALRGHHHKQQYHRDPGAFVIEIPKNAHSIGNKAQHPLGNKKGVGLTSEQRADWDKVRKAFHKERAKQELIRRGALNERQ